MLPFAVTLRPGEPIQEQVVYAVARAIMRGQLQPGDSFPSVRVLSQELRINPNTAHKIVATLVEQGLLEVRPGIGTVVGKGQAGTAAERKAVLDRDSERLVVEARLTGVTLQDLIDAIRKHWARTNPRSE